VKIRCRPWCEQTKPGRFSKSDFQLDLRSRVVTCPAGKKTTYTKTNPIATFEPDACACCRLRPRCTDSPKGRSIRVHDHESLLRKLKMCRATSGGRRHLRIRVAVEHRLA